MSRLSHRVRWPLRGIAGARAKGQVDSKTAPADLTPASYRTFSKKIAPGLTAMGGALAVMGGLGTWIRVERLEDEYTGPERVATFMGYAQPEGVVIAALGALALAAALLWFSPRLLPKLVPTAAALATVVLIVLRLVALANQSEGLAAEARRSSDLQFISFHASLGWGAWTLLVAAVLLALGLGAGVLRELDRRKGFPE